MIVCVESNFILEVALGQEQAVAAEELLEMAERRALTLVIPQFCLSEPFSTITARARERARLARQIGEQLRQLERSSPHQQQLATLRAAPGVLGSFEHAELSLLESTVQRVLAAGESVALDDETFHMATDYRRALSLSSQDATIYACVIRSLSSRAGSEPACFVSRNFKDFGDPRILQELGQHGCHYADSFGNALRFVNGEPPPFTVAHSPRVSG